MLPRTIAVNLINYWQLESNFNVIFCFLLSRHNPCRETDKNLQSGLMICPGSHRNLDFYWVFIAIFTTAAQCGPMEWSSALPYLKYLKYFKILYFKFLWQGRWSPLLWRSHLSMLAAPGLHLTQTHSFHLVPVGYWIPSSAHGFALLFHPLSCPQGSLILYFSDAIILVFLWSGSWEDSSQFILAAQGRWQNRLENENFPQRSNEKRHIWLWLPWRNFCFSSLKRPEKRKNKNLCLTLMLEIVRSHGNEYKFCCIRKQNKCLWII